MKLKDKGIKYAETYPGTGRYTGRFIRNDEEQYLHPESLSYEYVGDMTEQEFNAEFKRGEHRIGVHDRNPDPDCPLCEEG